MPPCPFLIFVAETHEAESRRRAFFKLRNFQHPRETASSDGLDNFVWIATCGFFGFIFGGVLLALGGGTEEAFGARDMRFLGWVGAHLENGCPFWWLG